MADSQYWKHKMDDFKAAWDKKEAELEELKTYQKQIEEAQQLLSAMIPRYEKIGSFLTHVVVSGGDSYDDGYFQECADNLKQCDEQFTSLLVLIKETIQKTKEKIGKLKSDYNTARSNYHNSLASEQAAAQAAAAQTSSGGDSSTPASTPAASKANLKACFLKGTKVITDTGKDNIENITENTLVLTYNEETKENEYKKVLKLLIHEDVNEELYTITFDNYNLDTTASHRFFVGGEWIEAKNLKVNDELMYFDGTLHKIENVTSINMKDTYYNLEVEDNHNYFVSDKGVLVHNRKMIE